MQKVDPEGVAICGQLIGKKRVQYEFHIKGQNRVLSIDWQDKLS